MSSKDPVEWVVETTVGERVYRARNSAEARSQHKESYPDELVTNIQPLSRV